MHLCNYSINKYHSDYIKCDDPDQEDQGCNSIALKMAQKWPQKWNFEKGHMSQTKKKLGAKRAGKRTQKRAQKLNCY